MWNSDAFVLITFAIFILAAIATVVVLTAPRAPKKKKKTTPNSHRTRLKKKRSKRPIKGGRSNCNTSRVKTPKSTGGDKTRDYSKRPKHTKKHRNKSNTSVPHTGNYGNDTTHQKLPSQRPVCDTGCPITTVIQSLMFALQHIRRLNRPSMDCFCPHAPSLYLMRKDFSTFLDNLFNPSENTSTDNNNAPVPTPVRLPEQIREVRTIQWFEELFGVDEQFFHIHNQFTYDSQTGMLTAPNNKVFHAGHFSRPTLGELRLEMARYRRGVLKVDHVASLDVMDMHGEIKHRHACFQVASQFNCLEFPGAYVTPELGITDYVCDRTQGPACAIATGPATIVRNYFVPVGGEMGQSEHNQIDNFEDVGRHLRDDATREPLICVKNGYTSSTDENLKKATEIIKSGDRDMLLSKLRVGVQVGAQVVCTGRTAFDERIKLLDDPGQVVTQVFCSAISCGYTSLSEDAWESVARLVLDATYEATLLAAAKAYSENGKSNRVFLTFIGGGVFRNRQEWIIAAINRALRKAADLDLHVTIVHYRSINESTKAAIISHVID